MANVIVSPTSRVTRGSWILDLGGDLRDLARTLTHRAHLERVAGNPGNRVPDALFGNGNLEELAAELFVRHVVMGVHGVDTVSRPLAQSAQRGR